MDQQMDAFTQRRFELMVEMATKKLQQEIQGLKEHISSLSSEMGSLKSQVNRLQFQPQQSHHISTSEQHANYEEQAPQKKEVKIVDCRPEGERREEFQGGSAKNSEPIRPRYGDYESKDVSIDKFFYFGRK